MSVINLYDDSVVMYLYGGLTFEAKFLIQKFKLELSELLQGYMQNFSA